jgi:hypothetical protein
MEMIYEVLRGKNLQNITAELLFKNYKRQYIYTLTEDLEVVFCFEHYDVRAGLKKLSSVV